MGAMRVPSRLLRLARQEGGASWIDALPALAKECAEAWGLRALGQPFADSSVSLVLPAELPEGRPVVLKLQFPHRESEHEAEALEQWGGDGAVKLVAHDSGRNALLIERCLPGAHLSTRAPDEAISVLADLLPRLWKPAGKPFTTLREEATLWRQGLVRRWQAAGRPFERRLLDAASEALRDLTDTQGEQVLIHQDLHGDNVLAAEREPWLAIDPKPLVGEREFAVAPLCALTSLDIAERLYGEGWIASLLNSVSTGNERGFGRSLRLSPGRSRARLFFPVMSRLRNGSSVAGVNESVRRQDRSKGLQ